MAPSAGGRPSGALTSDRHMKGGAMHFTPLRFRRFARASLTAAAIPLVMVMFADTASAAPGGQPKVHVNFEAAQVQFTDCPDPATVSEDTDCLGADVFEAREDKHVGNQHVRSTELDVTIVPVHIDATTGDVTIGTLLAVGSISPKVDINGLGHERIKATLTLSDDSPSTIDVTLKGTGKQQHGTFRDTFPEPLCPDGFVDITIKQQVRDARAVGTLTYGDATLVPTDSLLTPYLLQEHDDGICTNAPPPPV